MTATWTHPAYGTAIEFVCAQTGLVFPPNRRRDAEAGVRRAMAKVKASDPMELVERLSADRRVLDHLIGELTVGETYFFREPQQFELIRRQVLPELRRLRHPAATIQVWSAGCASGEEAYSLAILLEEESLADRSRILATDISPAALARARIATYGAWSLRGDQGDLADRYFRRQASRLVLAGRFRDRVRFASLNLAADDYPSLKTGTTALDLILCRNVLIYFDQATVRKVAGGLLSCLADGGWLITGPSDPPLWDHAPYETVVTPAGVFYRRSMRSDPSSVETHDPLPPRPLEPAVVPPAAERTRETAGHARSDPLAEARKAFAAGDHASVVRLTGGLDSDPAACALRIRALANLGDAAAATSAAAAASADHPLSPELHHLRAVLLVELGRFEKAAEAARRVIYLDRSLIVAHLTLGTILRRSGNVEGARHAYRNALALCSTRPPRDIVPLSDDQSAGQLAKATQSQLARLEAELGVPA